MEENMIANEENLTPESVENEASDALTEEVNQENEGDETETQEDPKEVELRKIRNGLTRRNQKINKLKAENRQFYEELSSLKETVESLKGKNNAEPQLEDFESVTDYMNAFMEYKMAEVNKSQGEKKIKQEPMDKVQANQEQLIQAHKLAEQHAQKIPDFHDVINESADIFDEMPDNIAELFLLVDDSAMAAYNLAKNGKLEKLINMNPQLAMIEIHNAQTYAPMKKITKAPRPISSVKGNGSGVKSTDEMSGRELLKKYGF